MAGSSASGALRALTQELKSLRSQPVEGFHIDVDDDNLFMWTIGIFGPPGTLYQVLHRLCNISVQGAHRYESSIYEFGKLD